MNKTTVIKNFLVANTHNDLSALYNYNMEVQVLVGQNGGVAITGEYYGKNWQGWQDPNTGTTWKSFRIPYNPNKEPFYEDKPINFDINKYVEGIGLTGWDWVNKQSKWVAFDFDAITGHSEKHTKKLANEELYNIERINIPWVTIRRSTSGNGLHLYVFIGNEITTNNHCEHQALARYILGKLAGETGLDLEAKVDARGNIMWIWHKKMIGTNGLTLIKQGSPLEINDLRWKEHIPVIEGKRKKIAIIKDHEGLFEESCSQQSIHPLDEEHKRLILWLSEHNYYCNWDIDHKLLITHTAHLKDAYKALNYIGIYDTLAEGNNKSDYNCFCLPLTKGSWVIRRYNPGVAETDCWFQDNNGWTTTYYNRIPTFEIACKSFGGLENKKASYVFSEGKAAIEASKALGITIDLPVSDRQVTLSRNKAGKLIVEFEKDKNRDSPKDLVGWVQETKSWLKVHNAKLDLTNAVETPNFDETIRHLVTEDNQDSGWRVKSDNIWTIEPIINVKSVLAVHGVTGNNALAVMGAAVLKKWVVVNRPFEPEFLENRRWNLNAAQLKYAPSLEDNPHFPHWQMIFNHCGKNLTPAITTNQWCIQNGITDGATYLQLWVASLIQQPSKHLPYLFFYGPQNVGKSTFYESLCLIITKEGIREANTALMSQGNFNGELSQAVLCYVEEIDLNNKGNGVNAYNKIKNWVTNDYLTIHSKGYDPYTIPNSTHWIHTSNHVTYCPVFPGDLRIVVIRIDPLDSKEIVPKEQFKEYLRKEAPDFLNYILKISLPQTNERLNLPVIQTAEKIAAEQSNMTLVERFVDEKIFYYPGQTMRFAEFCDLFREWLNNNEPNEMHSWSRNKIKAGIPNKFAINRSSKDNNQVTVINISTTKPTEEQLKIKPLMFLNERLI